MELELNPLAIEVSRVLLPIDLYSWWASNSLPVFQEAYGVS